MAASVIPWTTYIVAAVATVTFFLSIIRPIYDAIDGLEKSVVQMDKERTAEAGKHISQLTQNTTSLKVLETRSECERECVCPWE